MSSGDIARKLGITVEATDKASGKLAGVKREVAGIQGAAAMSGSRFSSFVGGVERGASRMKASIGNAAAHAKRQLSGLASGAAGFLGFGGLLGLGAVIGKSIGEASEFGANVNLVAKATGLAASTASAMVDTLDKWGISSDRLIPMLGKMEKNVGAIAAKKDGLKAFGKAFGLSLTDNKGHLLDANQLLLKSADYFNSNATASQKAVVMSKLWGKNWQDMIPILSKGSAFIRQQEKDSIHLTQQQLDNITKYRNAQREFQDTLGDVEVKIGSNIMPLLTEGFQTAGAWLDSHGDDVANWFRDAGGAVKSIVGTAIDVVGGIKAAWEAIPAPLRDLIIKGVVADRTMKFLFGFSPGALVVKLGEGVIEGVGKAVVGGIVGAGIGKAFVQPVFVTNQGFGGGGGLPNLLPGAGGAVGAAGAAAGAGGVGIGTMAAVALAPIAVALIPYVIAAMLPRNPANFTGTPTPLNRPSGPGRPLVTPTSTSTNTNSAGSPDDRGALDNIWRAALKTSDRTEGVRIAIASASGRQAAASELAGRIAANASARVRDSVEANRITLLSKQFIAKVTVPVTINNRVTAGGVTRAITTTAVYNQTVNSNVAR